MRTPSPVFRSTLVSLVLAISALADPIVEAMQRGVGGSSENLRQATQLMNEGRTADAIAAVRRELQTNPTSTQAANLLDLLGATTEARQVFQRAIDAATDPAANANLQRSMAMSYAFDGDCANTVKYEELVIAYWVTRERAEPQNAFYQQGEMANEAARVCIDAGDLDTAERMYRRGTELGLKEPGNQTHPRSLWDYRLAHALGRIAARRGDAAEAQRQIAVARRALDDDRAMAEAQERFFPYLVGYVALYTNDLPKAESELTKAIQTPGNQGDPFMHALLGLTYEKLGQSAKARDLYERAYGLSTAHNPPAAFTRPFTRAKLGLR
jgi:tetratricopeptide (TPR) repeat protein